MKEAADAKGKGAAKDDDDDDAEEESLGGDDNDDDAELSWQLLDTARLIFERIRDAEPDNVENTQALILVCRRLADHSIVSENCNQAVTDYACALKLLNEVHAKMVGSQSSAAALPSAPGGSDSASAAAASSTATTASTTSTSAASTEGGGAQAAADAAWHASARVRRDIGSCYLDLATAYGFMQETIQVLVHYKKALGVFKDLADECRTKFDKDSSAAAKEMLKDCEASYAEVLQTIKDLTADASEPSADSSEKSSKRGADQISSAEGVTTIGFGSATDGKDKPTDLGGLVKKKAKPSSDPPADQK